MATQKLLFLELNEVNFEYVQAYAELGLLPELAGLIDQYGVSTTTSESKYEELEPWIQWVTAHTGLNLKDHGVYRLGDIVDADLPQVWETLESKGVTVGAISPMNAVNKTKSARFFVPDPWTRTTTTGSYLLKKMYGAISEAVNENSSSSFSASSIFWLLAGAAVYARPTNYLKYMQFAFSAIRRPWMKAMFLDLLLADVFVCLTRKARPGFATLFLNAGAHIQHHYMFNSHAYKGDQVNPSWYVDPKDDPVLDVYSLYDRVVGQIRRSFPECRIMIATGLHQDPHEKLTFYWRLKDHSNFLSTIGVPFEQVLPRMSRDFLITCNDAEEARVAQQILESVKSSEQISMFEVDNRGADLFVMLTYSKDIGPDFHFSVSGVEHAGFRDHVSFVAIKNGQHNGIGYFLDTGIEQNGVDPEFPLAGIYSRVNEALVTQ